MTNKKIADLISNGLRTGLIHPGRDGSPPTPVLLPMFRTTGMPPELAELADETANLLAEAIVALIEEGSEIIDKEQAVEFRVADEAAPRRQVTVHCRCDKTRTDPLAVLTVTNSPSVVIDGKTLIKGLSDRSIDCPHRRNP
jgi:hypothetical protein